MRISGWQVTLAALSGVYGQEAYSPPKYPSPWANGEGDWAIAYQKAVQFVSQLNLAEKVNLTTGTGWQLGQCVGETGSVPRLNFRGLCLQDGPLGIRFADYISAFPAGINVGATWDRKLSYLRGKAMGEESRDKGIDVLLGPSAGPLGRFPDGGRNWEGYSPDPVLSGILMAETIKGIQDEGIIATAKHYLLNEQEQFRQGSEDGFEVADAISANVDDKTLHELYLWPFADAVRAGVVSIMCSYNQINNSYGCGNSYLLNYVLKEELGFQGFVMSDWGAHHSGVGSAMAGLDMSMPGDITFDSGTSFWGTNLTVAVLNGTVPQWRVDDMAVRILSTFYKVGRDQVQIPVNFDSWTRDTEGPLHFVVNETWTKINDHVDVRRDHAKIARQVAAASAVLLKNVDGALPLTGKERFVGVFGEDAGSNPLGPNGCPDRGCDNGTLAMGWGSGTADFPYLITPEQAIGAEVVKNGGVFAAITSGGAIKESKDVARQADTCLVFGNADSGEGYISVDGNGGDRNNLTLWQNAEAIIDAVASECNNTIVVLHSVGPVVVEDWVEHPNITAVLWAGLPGQESGNALVDVLYGKVNPGGKTPFTWGKSRKDWGNEIVRTPNNGAGAPQDNFSDGIFIDYRHFDQADLTPRWEFGFGLSYTTFKFSDLTVEPINAPPYTPTQGHTKHAPTFGRTDGKPSDFVFPEDEIRRIPLFVYPYLNSTDLEESANDPDYGLPTEDYVPEGALDSSPQPLHPAGGAPGGNPRLYDPVARVSVTVTNTGNVAGDEVPQVYVSLGGPDDAPKVLRGFDRITLQPGESKRWTVELTRRDVSNWDVASQNWVVTEHPKRVFVGNSSRNLPLQAPLNLSIQ
uniref:beta-glucosidase n=1 Tax=Paecilomyces sp. 'thermophila' TaxID=566408 RepID=J9PDC5_9EURO|nr:beta-glucosidase [Paecilomyces sp. 'thermophila']